MAARSALDLLLSVHPEQAQREDGPLPSVPGDPLGRIAGMGRARPLARRNALQLLEVLPRQGRPREQMGTRQSKALHRRWVLTRFANRLAKQVRRFHRSGRAVTAGDFMLVPAGPVRMPAKRKGAGSGKWKSWTPEAVQMAAFATGSFRQAVASLKGGHGRTAVGPRSPWQVA